METFLLETGSPKTNISHQDSPHVTHSTAKSPEEPSTKAFEKGKNSIFSTVVSLITILQMMIL